MKWQSFQAKAFDMHHFAGLSAREKARLRRLAKKRPADGGAQKGSSKKQQAGGGTDASAEARRLTAGLRLPVSCSCKPMWINIRHQL